MEEWKLRLKEAREAKGLSKTAFARAVGVSNPTVTDWEKGAGDGGIIEISGVKLMKVSQVLDVTPNWILHGEGAAGDAASPAAHAQSPGAHSEHDSPFVELRGKVSGARMVRADDDPDTVPVPRVRLRLRAGVAQFDTEPDLGGDGFEDIPRTVLAALHLDPQNLLAVRVRGTSMEPMMFEDDAVIIDRSDIKPINRELYAVNFDGEALIKQLLYRGGQWYLHSVNPDFGPVNVRSGQCSIVGRVVYQPGRVVTGRL